MEPGRMEGPACQSCGIPLGRTEDQGTNADGSKNREYCFYCFENGAFTDPDMTMEQMISKVVGFLSGIDNMTEEKAKVIANTFIPPLKRWQN